MGGVNWKATDDEMAHATQVVQEAYPEYEVVWGSHGDYGGGRAPPRPHAVVPTPRPHGRVSFQRHLGRSGWLVQPHRRVGPQGGQAGHQPQAPIEAAALGAGG